ncbi:MAG: hypothetical protein ACI4AH_04860 [Muribaculaceae bacterium]
MAKLSLPAAPLTPSQKVGMPPSRAVLHYISSSTQTMNFRENSINDFFNSKVFTLLMAIVIIAISYLDCTIWQDKLSTNNSHGIFFQSVAQGISGATMSVVLNSACILVVAILMVALNKTFNFIRSVTWVFASVFLMLTASNPITSGRLYSGTLICLAVIIISFIMFASFQQRRSQRNVFTAFGVIATFSMFQYAFIYLLPVVALGFMLMKVMNLRSFLAMIIGIVTPFWIVLGLNLADFNNFALPSYESFWTVLERPQMHINIIGMVLLALLTIGLVCANLFHIITYKLQVRAYNGFFVYLSAFTTLMLAIDYRNAFNYLPVLHLCLGVQFAHFFTINTHTRRYIAMILLLLVAVALRVATHIM